MAVEPVTGRPTLPAEPQPPQISQIMVKLTYLYEAAESNSSR